MSPNLTNEFPDQAMHDRHERIVCRECGREHQPVALRPGERALCVQCNTVLAKRGRLGGDAALAYTVTGLLLILPAALLPFVTVSKLGNEHVGLLFTGVTAMWDNGMSLLAVWVLACGGLAPIFLLGTLAGLLVPRRFGLRPAGTQFLWRAAHAVAHWAMPEVQVLAVLVAVAKLGIMVNVTIGPGFWCYSAMAVMTLLAWRDFELEPATGPSVANLHGTATVS